jgi:hypothetical protein
MLMWADRLLDSHTLGYSQWEADIYGTHRARDHVPRDVILLDWHYDPRTHYPSVPLLLEAGFTVWPCCWKDPKAALAFLRDARLAAHAQDASTRLPGMLVTCWNASATRLEAVLLDGADLAEDKDDVGNLIKTLHIVMTALNTLP